MLVVEVDHIVVFDGEARRRPMVSRLTELTGPAVRVSSAEAVALGPVIGPGVAVGSFASPVEGRAKIGGDGGRSDDETTC